MHLKMTARWAPLYQYPNIQIQLSTGVGYTNIVSTDVWIDMYTWMPIQCDYN